MNRFEPPMHMRTWSTEPFTCPWCHERVQADEVHDDDARNKFGREPKEKRSVRA